jgi:protein-tyrosine phosphatase
MAEYLFSNMIEKEGLSSLFLINSAATSSEEIWGDRGNPVHPGTRRILNRLGISCDEKRAVQIKKEDYKKYDYIICMDNANVKNVERICGRDTENKIHLLLEYTDENRDVADPWYTGDFEKTYKDIKSGLEGFYKNETLQTRIMKEQIYKL